MLRNLFSLRSWASFLTHPGYRWLHGVIIASALIIHLSLHYATYIPALRGPIGDLPYFKLHILHEAEFMLIIFYTVVVFRLKGGLIAVGLSGLASIPFLLTPYIFGREPREGEIRDLAIQVFFILLMGVVFSLLYEAVTRERERRLALADRVEAANRQLNALNGAIQGNLNRIYDDLGTAVEEEQRQLASAPSSPDKERFARFIQKIEEITTSR